MRFLKKTGGIAATFIFSCMLVIGVCMILLNLLGYRLLAIRTGSMQDVYDVGTLVLVHKTSAEEIQVGDVISYVVDEKLTVVTHRVIEIDSANKCFYTKGDRNQTTDEKPVVFENLIGKVVCGIPFAGYVILFVQSKAGKLVLEIVIVVIIFFLIQQGIYRRMKHREERKESRDEEVDRIE